MLPVLNILNLKQHTGLIMQNFKKYDSIWIETKKRIVEIWKINIVQYIVQTEKKLK